MTFPDKQTRTNRMPFSPYKGLVPFQEADTSFFFGRDHEAEIIADNLLASRLTLLYGPAGVGKTSLLRAGVFHQLHVRSRRDYEESANPKLVVITFSSWLGDVLSNLKLHIEDSISATLGKSVSQGSGSSLSETISVNTEASDVELMIILDQFEEYFLYHPSPLASIQFADELARVIANPKVRANFLISIREDWLGRLDSFRGRVPHLLEKSIRIDHLTREAARAAIEKPIEKYNALLNEQHEALGGKGKVAIERAFTMDVLDQLALLDEPREASLEGAGNKPDDRRIQTSRLQLVLTYLWDKIKDDTRPALGRQLLAQPDTAKRIFQLHLEESLQRLTQKEKRLAADLFRFLVTPSGTKFASTPKELAIQCNGNLEAIDSLLKKLSEGEVRVLSTVAPPPGRYDGETYYELTSDVLARTILDWTKDMREQGRRQRAFRRRSLITAVVLLGVLVVVVGLALRNARRQGQEIAAAQHETLAERDKALRALAAVRDMDHQVPYSKAVLRGHSRRVMTAVFTAAGRVLTASADQSAILWDVESGNPIREFSKNEPGEKALVCAAINPAGNVVVTASTDGIVRLWNLAEQEPRQLRERVGRHVTDISFSPKGDLIAAANTLGTVMIWNTASGALVKEIPGNGNAIRQISFSPSGNLLAAASEDMAVHIWRGGDWSGAAVLEGHTDRVNGIAFSPDERFIASASRDSTVRIWNLTTGVANVFTGHLEGVNSVAYDRAGTHLLSASDDTTARIWTIATAESKVLIGHTDKVLSASFNSDGSQVVTAGRDNVARIWSLTSAKTLVELRGHLAEITYVSYSKDGQFVLTASDDGTARIWYAPQLGGFEIDEPKITATPNSHPGDCPVTIRFVASITALNGSGTVVYRFKGSDGTVWPPGELTFDQPGSRYVTWSWRVNSDYAGSETIEIIEPKGIKEQKARFTVKCTSQAERK